MLAPCLGGLSFQPTKSDAVECDSLCNRLTTISFKKMSREPLRDLPSSFYSGGCPVPPRLSVIHWAPPSVMPRLYCLFAARTSLQLGRSAPGLPVLPQPSYAPFFAQFPKLIDPRSAIPCFLYVSARASLPTRTTRRLPSPSCLRSISLLYAHAASPRPVRLPPQGTYSALNSQCSLNPRRDPHPRLLIPIPSVRILTCSPPSVHIHHHGNAACIKAPSYPSFFRV
ncbi:hypothetical protein B0H14DRAFT_3874555 [Mycena olivaceomarginata]|nr:hypothetical protein B0H14DRAFT_3874555 [Mycena olivaceomarginata]